MADQELKACPFCGKDEPLINHIEPHPHPISGLPDFGGSVTIECRGCDMGFIKATEAEAIAAWNARSEQVGVPTGDLSTTVQAGEFKQFTLEKYVPLQYSNGSAAPSQPVAVPQLCDYGNEDDFRDALYEHELAENDRIVGAMQYNGNTVSYMYSKARNYGNVVLECHKLIGKQGHVVDTLKALISERDALLTTANAGKDAKPTYTTGHCEHNKQPGGCQQHNLHCGWPKCDQKEINHA